VDDVKWGKKKMQIFLVTSKEEDLTTWHGRWIKIRTKDVGSDSKADRYVALVTKTMIGENERTKENRGS